MTRRNRSKMISVGLLLGIAACAWYLFANQAQNPEDVLSLRARADKYAQLKLEGKWSDVYKLIDPKDRRKMGEAEFLRFYAHGVLDFHDVKVKDIQMINGDTEAKVVYDVDAELNVARMPLRFRNNFDNPEDPNALKRKSEDVQIWVKRKGFWYFRIDPQIIRGRIGNQEIMTETPSGN